METQPIIALCGITFGTLIVLALLLRPDANRRANRLLAFSLICQILYLVQLFFLHHPLRAISPLWSLLALLLSLTVPLLVSYTKVMIQPGYHFSLKDFAHLVPFLILSILITTTESFKMGTVKEATGIWPPNPISILAILYYLLVSIYLFFTVKMIRTHQARILQKFSYQSKVTLQWLAVLLSVYLALVVIGLILSVIHLFPSIELWPRTLYSMSSSLIIFYLIAFAAISQPAIFSERSKSARKKMPTSGKAKLAEANKKAQATEYIEPKYETSSLTTTASNNLWGQLQRLMTEQKPYLNNELRISDLAELSGIPANHLSQVINQLAGKNFFEFINHYRLEEAKKILAKPRTKIATAALEAGFNSQSAFYKQFKKMTNLTPKQFQRDHTK